jgi:hypothetical protein
MGFSEYYVKMKHFYGSSWRDEWKVALFEVYRMILQIMNSFQMAD